MKYLFLVLLLLIAFGSISTAQWSHDPNANNPVSVVAASDQSLPKIIGDGAGGTIIVWLDNRSGNNDIYAQRINATGARQWLSSGNYDGVPICSIPSSQHDIVIVSDGTGGAIITWDDKSNNFDLDIYAQRVDGSGVVQWASGGVPISTLVGGIYPSNQEYPTITSDGAGGAIIVWLDTRNYYTTGLDIYAQRINANGVRQWANGSDSNGVAISTAINAQVAPEIVSDGAGGAIITWYDARNDIVHSDVYAQRINASGSVQWTTNGVAVCTATDQQQNPQIVSDGAGGAIIAWEDFRSGTSYDIYAQHINAAGVRQWAVGVDSNGVAISTAANDQSASAIVSDGAAGAIVAWQDLRSGISSDIYAQHLSAGGTRQWIVGGDSNGVAVCTATDQQQNPQIVSDGSGGSIITWGDARSGTSSDIYAQHLSAGGIRQWIVSGDSNGVAVSTALNDQVSPTILSDGAGGSFITWSDHRNGADYDLYAQWIDANGYLGGPASALQLSATSLNFGNVPTNLSKTDSVTVISNGNVPLSISSVTSTSGDFTVISSNDTIGVGQSKNYSVTFKPQSFGAGSGKIIFHSNASSSPDTVSVTGTGINPLYTITPTTINFGLVPSDSTRYDSITVKCLDLSLFMSVSSVTSNDTDLTISPTSASIAYNDSQVFHLSFHPTTQYVSRVDTITFTHNDFGSPNRVICTAVGAVTFVDTVQDSWNMVSVPVSVSDFRKSHVYPTAISSAFAYQGGYQPRDTLKSGMGYWAKFSSSQPVSYTGAPLDRDTIDVNAQWNIIGSISTPVNIASITSVPGGIVTSEFFGYNGAYQVASTIDPGKAYWVRVTQNGKLVLSNGTTQSSSGLIRIVPTGELPPPLPDGGERGQSTAKIPDRFSLEQNFPNPFNPTTMIRFGLPEDAIVTLKVYNILGQPVATLLNHQQLQAGIQTTYFDAGRFPSGVYVYRLSAGNFIDNKKMVLMK